MKCWICNGELNTGKVCMFCGLNNNYKYWSINTGGTEEPEYKKMWEKLYEYRYWMIGSDQTKPIMFLDFLKRIERSIKEAKE